MANNIKKSNKTHCNLNIKTDILVLQVLFEATRITNRWLQTAHFVPSKCLLLHERGGNLVEIPDLYRIKVKLKRKFD